MLWQEAALPMWCYVVRKTTTRATPATYGRRGRLGRCNFTFPRIINLWLRAVQRTILDDLW